MISELIVVIQLICTDLEGGQEIKLSKGTPPSSPPEKKYPTRIVTKES